MAFDGIRRAAIVGFVSLMGSCVFQLFGGGHGAMADDTLVAAVLFRAFASAGVLGGRVMQGLGFLNSAGVAAERCPRKA